MLVRKTPQYNIKNIKFEKITDGGFLKDKFYLMLPPLPTKFDCEKTLISIPGAFELRVIKRSYGDDIENKLVTSSIYREHCFYFNEKDEWMLEAELKMETFCKEAKENFYIRLPFSAPFMKDGSIGIFYDGTWIRMLKDSRLLNQDSGLDKFCEPCGDVFIDELVKDTLVSHVTEFDECYVEEKTNASAGFYFPSGFNTNVGDVMSFYHNGTYHVLYLFDTKHHGSRNGGGAHYISQITTNNLIDWYEQKPVVSITEPWMTLGTGTMLYHKGKYYMSYGLHTERYKGKTPIIEPSENSETREYEVLAFEDIFKSGGYPGGMTYSVSDDGICFEPSGKLLHCSRNPSAYVNEKGGVSVFCGYGADGIYEAESFDGPLKKAENSIDFQQDSIMGNSNECPAMFSWNGYKYIIVGFTGYFRTLSPESDKFEDAAKMGEYVYDGLSVPMVAEFKDNRRIMAGWVRSPLGWGGVLMQRELVFEDAGKLGMKWVPELMPKLSGKNLISDKELKENIPLKAKTSNYFSVHINPNTADKVCFSLSDGNSFVVCTLDIKNRRLQINDAEKGSFGKPLETIIEQMRRCNKEHRWYKEDADENIPQNAVNFALSDIEGMDNPFGFKMLLRYSKKLRCTVIDAEIAEIRTFISVREDFYPTEISVFSDRDADFKGAELYEFETVE